MTKIGDEMKLITARNGETIEIGKPPRTDVHEFLDADIDALNAALAAKRPLLLRGEPGVGKTQLAIAAAINLGWGYCETIVDGRTDPQELRWREDLIARLADAQIAGTGGRENASAKPVDDLDHYLEPGPLWWAFNWKSAVERMSARTGRKDADIPAPEQPDPRCNPANGMVLLIDEIDKADPELPNSLLEALGSGKFTPRGFSKSIEADPWPLVIVTTNNERLLPHAFIRRCLVHEMELPPGNQLKEFLVQRGKLQKLKLSDALIEKAADWLIEDRTAADRHGLAPLPGQAEFLDLLRAAHNLKADEKRLEKIRPFFLHKHEELRA